MSRLATTIWIDPGGTTGWAVMSVHVVALRDPDYSVLQNVVHWSTGDFRGSEPEMADCVLRLFREWPDAAIGTEDFILGQLNQDRALLSPVRVNAMLEFGLFRERGPRRPLFTQRAVEVMQTCNDDRLKKWGFYGEEPKSREHARDARRHALYFLRRAAMAGPQAEALRKSAWPHLFNGSRKQPVRKLVRA